MVWLRDLTSIEDELARSALERNALDEAERAFSEESRLFERLLAITAEGQSDNAERVGSVAYTSLLLAQAHARLHEPGRARAALAESDAIVALARGGRCGTARP